MDILIAGDLFIADYFRSQGLISQSVENLFRHVDYRIVNLEAPITNENPKNKLLKTGRHLRMSEEVVIPYCKQLNVDCVTMANNHVLDYGADGLLNSLAALERNSIAYVGAGEDLLRAAKPITIDQNDVKVAILNFCENEWSIAEKDKPGANPLDIIDNVKQIQSAKMTHDKVICIIHGGHEYYHLPSPRMVKQYRFYADNGADVIVGHHTHCIGGYEIYKDTPIFYSLGNFLFTLRSNKNVWYTGLIVVLSIDKETSVNFEIIPINQQQNTFRVDFLKKEENLTINQKIEELNLIIRNETELEKKWFCFQKEKQQVYLNIFNPIQIFNNRLIIYILTRFKINKCFMRKRQYKYILNMLRCESHHSLSKDIVRNFVEKRKWKF